DRTSGCLYATVFDNDSIVQFDPVSGETRATIPLGEAFGPGAAAGFRSRAFVISDDGRFGFVVVSNGYYLRQVDLVGRTLGPRFAVGSDIGGPMFALDMLALPGGS